MTSNTYHWTYADTKDDLIMECGWRGYVACPYGAFIREDHYAGDCMFDGIDVFELVALWNREYLASHPEHIIRKMNMQVKDCGWYKWFSNLDNFAECGREQSWHTPDLATIGWCIASDTEDNANLPYPIKITMVTDRNYDSLPPSKFMINEGNGYEWILARSFRAIADCVLNGQGCEKCFIYTMGHDAGCHDVHFSSQIKEYIDYMYNEYADEARRSKGKAPFYREAILSEIGNQEDRYIFLGSAFYGVIDDDLINKHFLELNDLLKAKSYVDAEDIIRIVSRTSEKPVTNKGEIQEALDEYWNCVKESSKR